MLHHKHIQNPREIILSGLGEVRDSKKSWSCFGIWQRRRSNTVKLVIYGWMGFSLNCFTSSYNFEFTLNSVSTLFWPTLVNWISFWKPIRAGLRGAHRPGRHLCAEIIKIHLSHRGSSSNGSHLSSSMITFGLLKHVHLCKHQRPSLLNNLFPRLELSLWWIILRSLLHTITDYVGCRSVWQHNRSGYQKWFSRSVVWGWSFWKARAAGRHPFAAATFGLEP